MNVAATHRLVPRATTLSRSRGRGELAFTLLLLGIALTLLWFCRLHGPAFLQRWFVPLPMGTPLDFAILCGALFAVVCVHEGGHMVAALLLNFHFLGAAIGPWQIRTLHGKWKVTFAMPRLFNGSITALPRGMDYWRGSMLAVVAAGPLATLGTGWLMTGLHAQGPYEEFFRTAFVQVSSLIFLLGLIPNSRKATKRNDMRLFLDLALKNSGADEIELHLIQSSQVLEGIRPQDYDLDIMARLANWRGRTETELLFAQTLVRWAVDCGDIDLAGIWDAKALNLAEQCDKSARGPALAFSACLDVIYRDDLEAARRKFRQVDCGSLFPPCFEHLARAARHVSSGRTYRAPAEIIRAQYALPRGVVAYHFERMLLDRLHMRVLGGPAERGDQFQSASA